MPTRTASILPGEPFIAVDTVDAGPGDLVVLTEGSSARQTDTTTNLPVDAIIVAVIDFAGNRRLRLLPEELTDEGARQMLSVGIDIGTTTTQIIFCRLTLVEMARAGQIPRVDITDREVLYQSPIVFTPLLDAETVDAERLTGILRQEYAAGGHRPRPGGDRRSHHHRRDGQEKERR